jgi:biopolymer transport protein TolR
MIGPRRGKTRRGGQVMAEINITPFTDVVLVILIIFMVSASFMGAQNALNVNLPSAHASSPVKERQTLNVTIDAKQKVFLEGDAFSIEDLSGELQARHQKKPVDMVIVRADRGVPYERVIRVMDSVKLAGIENIAFPTKVKGITEK